MRDLPKEEWKALAIMGWFFFVAILVALALGVQVK